MTQERGRVGDSSGRKGELEEARMGVKGSEGL